MDFDSPLTSLDQWNKFLHYVEKNCLDLAQQAIQHVTKRLPSVKFVHFDSCHRWKKMSPCLSIILTRSRLVPIFIKIIMKNIVVMDAYKR